MTTDLNEALNRCMMNYGVAHRSRMSIDLAAASSHNMMLKREVPKMVVALSLVSKSDIWKILIMHAKDMLRVGRVHLISSQMRWDDAWNCERICKKAFLQARAAIEVRVGVDQIHLRRAIPYTVMALEDPTDSEDDEGEDAGEDAGDDAGEDAGEDAGGDVGPDPTAEADVHYAAFNDPRLPQQARVAYPNVRINWI